VVKRPEGAADYTPPSSAEVKNSWSYTSTPPVHLHGVVLDWSTGTALPFSVRLYLICIYLG